MEEEESWRDLRRLKPSGSASESKSISMTATRRLSDPPELRVLVRRRESPVAADAELVAAGDASETELYVDAGLPLELCSRPRSSPGPSPLPPAPPVDVVPSYARPASSDW